MRNRKVPVRLAGLLGTLTEPKARPTACQTLQSVWAASQGAVPGAAADSVWWFGCRLTTFGLTVYASLLIAAARQRESHSLVRNGCDVFVRSLSSHAK